MSKSPLHTLVANEAAKHGMTLESANFRTGLFFLRSGTEVRSSGRYMLPAGTTDVYVIASAVRMTARHGLRCDLLPGSKYYTGK